MKTKFKYIVLGSLLFGLIGFNNARATTWPELRQALLEFQAEVLQSFAEVNGTLDVHETRISDNEAKVTALENSQAVQDSNIEILDAGQQALQTNDTNQDSRLNALEANTNPVIKKAGWINNIGQPLGDFSISGANGLFWIIDQGVAWRFGIDAAQSPFYVRTDALHYDQPGCVGNAYVVAISWDNIGSAFGEIAVQRGGVDFNRNLYVGDLSAGSRNIPIASETVWQPNTNTIECRNYSSPIPFDIFNAIPAPFDNANTGSVTFDLLP